MLSKRLPLPKRYKGLSLPRLVNKPWGQERWLEFWGDSKTGRGYCLKEIFLKTGQRTSLQYHKTKVETQYIIRGKAEVSLENEDGLIEKIVMGKGDFFTIIPGRKHRVKALVDLTLLEVSTPEVEDVFRINDDYKRR